MCLVREQGGFGGAARPPEEILGNSGGFGRAWGEVHSSELSKWVILRCQAGVNKCAREFGKHFVLAKTFSASF